MLEHFSALVHHRLKPLFRLKNNVLSLCVCVVNLERLFCSKKIVSVKYTVGENIIATTKILNNYGAIQSFIILILR